MARVEIGEYRAQDAHYGFYRDDLPSGDVILIRRKVGDPTDYLHPNSRKVRQQRLNFGLASTHYSHLTPIQKKELKYVGEIMPFTRGRSKSDTKFLQGRTLFISKDIHALNETQKQTPTPLQICIVLTDQDFNPIEGDIWLRYLEDGEWKETTRRLLSPSYWLFPTVPRNMELYHPVGADYHYYDPQDPETTYLTQKELMLYHYHPLAPRVAIASEILRPNAPGDLCGIDWQVGEPCPNHWMNVDEEVPDENETYVATRYHDYFQYDLYRLEPYTIGVYDIKNITLVNRIRRQGSYAYSNYFRLLLKTHDQIFYQQHRYLPTSWTNYSWSFDNNPATNEPWTFEELDALQAGVSTKHWSGVGVGGFTCCTQVYIEVEYYAPE
ncbi:hypothetical protein ES705_24027 [subsurface metagenome]